MGDTELSAGARSPAGVRRRFMVATGVATFTHGVWVPAILLFFHYGRGLPLAATGAAMTLGGVVSLCTASPASGVVLDRIGPFRAKMLSSVLLAAVSVGFEFTHSLAQVALYCGLANASNALFFGADIEAVRRVTDDPRDRDKVFANLVIQRIIGFGAGAALGGLILAWSTHSTAAWDVMQWSLVGTNTVAALLFWRLRTVDDDWSRTRHPAGKTLDLPGYREVIRDGRFMMLVVATALIAVTVIGLDTALPIYLVQEGLPAFSATAVYAAACLLSVAMLPTVPAMVRRFGRAKLMVASSLLGILEYLTFWSVAPLHQATWAVVVALSIAAFLFAAGSVFSDTLPNTMVYDFAPEHASGRHSALINSGWSLAGVFCPLIYTALLSWDLSAPWLFSCTLAGLAGALFHSMAGRSGEAE